MNKNLINLKNRSNKLISIDLNIVTLDELKEIFNVKDGILFFKDEENESIIIKDKEDFNYFIEVLKLLKIENEILINNEIYILNNDINEFVVLNENHFNNDELCLNDHKNSSNKFIKII